MLKARRTGLRTWMGWVGLAVTAGLLASACSSKSAGSGTGTTSGTAAPVYVLNVADFTGAVVVPRCVQPAQLADGLQPDQRRRRRPQPQVRGEGRR